MSISGDEREGTSECREVGGTLTEVKYRWTDAEIASHGRITVLRADLPATVLSGP